MFSSRAEIKRSLLLFLKQTAQVVPAWLRVAASHLFLHGFAEGEAMSIAARSAGSALLFAPQGQ